MDDPRIHQTLPRPNAPAIRHSKVKTELQIAVAIGWLPTAVQLQISML